MTNVGHFRTKKKCLVHCEKKMSTDRWVELHGEKMESLDFDLL